MHIDGSHGLIHLCDVGGEVSKEPAVHTGVV